MKNDTNSLAHTTWKCKYNIVFASKFRRKEIYGELNSEIGLIIRELCKKSGNNRGRNLKDMKI